MLTREMLSKQPRISLSGDGRTDTKDDTPSRKLTSSRTEKVVANVKPFVKGG